jgi:GNAT superfamily N-acetyltransferase
MLNLLKMVKKLDLCPNTVQIDGINLRIYEGCIDIDGWLSIRNASFSTESVTERRWVVTDFEREFLTKPWWSPDRMWFAEVAGENGGMKAVGTITIGERSVGEKSLPTVNWLAVLPEWRGKGIGQLLLSTLEAAVWKSGRREIHLETHAAWTAALRMYKRTGYRVVSTA